MSIFIWSVVGCVVGAGAVARRLTRPLTTDELEAMRLEHWIHTRKHYPDVYWTDLPPAPEKGRGPGGMRPVPAEPAPAVASERAGPSLGGFDPGYALSAPGAAGTIA